MASFYNKKIFFLLCKNALAYYNAGDVAVSSKNVLAPELVKNQLLQFV
jgi:hypothetical protein